MLIYIRTCKQETCLFLEGGGGGGGWGGWGVGGLQVELNGRRHRRK